MHFRGNARCHVPLPHASTCQMPCSTPHTSTYHMPYSTPTHQHAICHVPLPQNQHARCHIPLHTHQHARCHVEMHVDLSLYNQKVTIKLIELRVTPCCPHHRHVCPTFSHAVSTPVCPHPDANTSTTVRSHASMKEELEHEQGIHGEWETPSGQETCWRSWGYNMKALSREGGSAKSSFSLFVPGPRAPGEGDEAAAELTLWSSQYHHLLVKMNNDRGGVRTKNKHRRAALSWIDSVCWTLCVDSRNKTKTKQKRECPIK